MNMNEATPEQPEHAAVLARLKDLQARDA